VLELALATLLLLFEAAPEVADESSDLAMWSFLIGAVLPFAISFVQQPRWPSGLRATVTVVSCVIVGAGTTYFSEGGIDLDGDLVSAILRVLIAAWGSYLAFWKPTGIAPALEVATSKPLENRRAKRGRGRTP
jgi:peptidoglycan/LPS O-acetylase OafA/YrhL